MNPPALRLLIAVVFGLSLLAAFSSSAHANDNSGLEKLARDFLQPAVDQALAEQAGTPLRAEVQMGSLDSRLRLAPCNAIEPFLPPNGRPAFNVPEPWRAAARLR